MQRRTRPIPWPVLRRSAGLAALCGAILTGCAGPETRYSAYSINQFGALGERVGVGRLELAERADEASVRIVADRVKVSPCQDVRLKAHVTRDDTTTKVITEPAYGVCEPVMYVLRNDGTGGDRYTQVNGAWAKETLNFGLNALEP